MSLLLLAGIVALSGCDGDTLYDAVPGDVDPPVVSVLSPLDGAEVQAGQRVPIRVSATDQEGVSTITLRITGAVTQTIVLQFAPPRTEVQSDTAITVPVGAVGTIQIGASGTNTQGVVGQAENVRFTISTVDGLAPYVSLSVMTTPRMELTDRIRVTVKAYDNPGGSGIASTALTAIVTNSARADTLILNPTDAFQGQASDTAVSEYSFTPPFIDPLNLPDTLRIVFFGIAYDKEANCGGAVSATFTNQVACSSVSIGGSPYVIANAVTDGKQVIAVSGRTSLAPGGGTLADILVDTLRSRVYVSNLSRNRIQTLQADPGTWGSEVWVGAEPWGLALNGGGDSLFVANSGGTSISFVSLVGAPKEDLGRRFVTQNNALWEVVLDKGKFVAQFYDFSDRPQFIAQDAAGRLLFSTRPTSAANTGTIRVASTQPGWSAPESKILVFAGDVVADEKTTTIVHVDSVYSAVDGSCVQIWDHRPGFLNVVVTSQCLPLDDALAAMEVHRAAGDTDLWYVKGSKWEIERLALRDTTFVAASGDRKWIAFGEGGTGPDEAGRITLWNSSSATIHSRLLVADLVNNASERVTGLDLNHDGSLGSASGITASYYWSTDLRLQGSVTKTVPGGAGAVLHPSLPSFTPGMPSSTNTLSFVGQADYTVRILDTTHFTE
ncbi:MAG: Ig-like domain-containing protein, partial [Longimicrobiales bacterium]|nr:Ig-like domain-containing protein [Longimicrobiales bacterium]